MKAAAEKGGKDSPWAEWLKKLSVPLAAIEAAAKTLKPGDDDKGTAAKAIKVMDAPLNKISDMHKRLKKLINSEAKDNKGLTDEVNLLAVRTDKLLGLASAFGR